MTEADLKTLTVLAGAIGSIVAALIAMIAGFIGKAYFEKKLDSYKAEQTRKLDALKAEQNEKLEHVRANLAQDLKAKSARIDYEYEARKRLYKEVEPSLFSAHLAASNITGRLSSFAARMREGHINLDPVATWMSDGYFQRSTAYRLFVPMVHRYSLSKRLSQLDLTLEPLIGRKYMVLSAYDDILVDHFRLADQECARIPYRPYAKAPDEAFALHPGTYRYQGLYRGQVENLVFAMSVIEAGVRVPKEWFQFEKELNDNATELYQAYRSLADLLTNFHPTTHPVLWRALISFVLLSDYYTCAKSYNNDEANETFEKMDWQRFDYVGQPGSEQDQAKAHFDAAREYIRKRLSEEFFSYATA